MVNNPSASQYKHCAGTAGAHHSTGLSLGDLSSGEFIRIEGGGSAPPPYWPWQCFFQQVAFPRINMFKKNVLSLQFMRRAHQHIMTNSGGAENAGVENAGVDSRVLRPTN